MNTRRVIFIMVAVCCAVALLAANSHAGYKLYDCQVLQAGPSGTNVYVMLTDVGPNGDFTDKYFRASFAKKEILATCLTAMNMGCLIEAKVDVGAALVKAVRLTMNPVP